ncbi:MAG: hypothetical protein WC004_01170, partial [Candidatus Absconditabacterales bacterium]
MFQKIVSFVAVMVVTVMGRYLWPQADIQVKALYQIQSAGLPLGTYQALIAFKSSSTGDYQVSLDLDSNRDGSIGTGERILSGLVLSVTTPGERLLPFVLDAVYDTGMSKQLVVLHILSDSGQTLTIQQRVRIIPYDIGKRLGLDTVKNPEESMKGSREGEGVETKIPEIAQDAVVRIKKGETPDISQQIAECAPTSAVNSLLRLMADHERIEELQGGNPYQLVGELKGLMKRTLADGVTPDNFVSGKQARTARRGLPITTKKVGTSGGEGTLDELQKVLESGGAAELRLRFTNLSRQTVGGHMVTVTAVRQVDDQRYIDVHDPLSPKGTETYQLEGNRIIGYSMHNGPTYVSVGFTQTREETIRPAAAATKQIVKPSETISVIVYKGSRIPMTSLRVELGPECKEGLGQMRHYHPVNTGGTVVDVSGSIIQDPDPDGCGFGFERDIPVE